MITNRIPFKRKRSFSDYNPQIGCSCFAIVALFALGIVLAYWGTIIYVAQHFIRKFW